jgi:hypothetical protein
MVDKACRVLPSIKATDNYVKSSRPVAFSSYGLLQLSNLIRFWKDHIELHQSLISSIELYLYTGIHKIQVAFMPISHLFELLLF